MHITDCQMKRLEQYETILIFLDKMLSDDILTHSEYEEAKKYVLQKYALVIRHSFLHISYNPHCYSLSKPPTIPDFVMSVQYFVMSVKNNVCRVQSLV